MNVHWWLNEGFFNSLKDGEKITDEQLHELFFQKTDNYQKSDFYWFRKVVLSVRILKRSDTEKKTYVFDQARLNEWLKARDSNEFGE